MLYCVSEDRMKLIHQICGSLSLVEFWGPKCFPLHIDIYIYLYVGNMEHIYIYIPSAEFFTLQPTRLLWYLFRLQKVFMKSRPSTSYDMFLSHTWVTGGMGRLKSSFDSWFEDMGVRFPAGFFLDSWTLDQTHTVASMYGIFTYIYHKNIYKSTKCR